MLPCECNFPKASRILSAVFKHTHTHTRTVEMAVSSSNQPDFRLSTLRSHEGQSWRQTSRLQTGFDPIDLLWTNVVSCSPFWVVLTRLSPCSVPYTIYTMTDGEAFGTLHNRDDESLACQNLVCLAAKSEMSYEPPSIGSSALNNRKTVSSYLWWEPGRGADNHNVQYFKSDFNKRGNTVSVYVSSKLALCLQIAKLVAD